VSGPTWRRYLRFWRGDVEADLDDEFRFHLETEIEELVARGLSPDAARAEALRRFGDVDLYRRYCRSADQRRAGRAHRSETLTVLAHDLRYAIRSLRRQPAFTLIAVLTLALGIGANTAIFSVVNGVLLRPLPYREPHRLVTIWETLQGSDDKILVSYPNYLDWRERQRVFEDIALYNQYRSFNLTGRGDAERVRGALVTGNYFYLLGVRPAVGRLIEPADDSPGSPRVAVVSYGFFQSRLGGDPGFIGNTLVLDGDVYTVVGVLPPEVRIADRDVILPVGLFVQQPEYARNTHPGLIGIGRLKPGMSLERARADLQRVSAELRELYPTDNSGIGSDGALLMDITVGRIRPALKLLTIAVGLLLLIACANVANLLLSRAAAREREFALRTALGAERGRIVRQLLTESVVLAFAGGVLGVGLAVAGVRVLVALDPRSVPRLMDIRVDGTVLLFALALSLVTGLLFGLVPALQSGRSQLASALKEGGRGASGGAARRRTRAILTIAEVALAVVLLAGAGLLVRSFEKLTAVDPGFQPAHVVAGVVQLPKGKYESVEQQRAALDRLLEKVRAIPGVESATIASDPPISATWQTGISFESHPLPDGSQLPLLNASVVDPEYFETLRIPLVAGRPFTASDGAGQPRVVLVSESIAKRFFPDANPIGQRMKDGQASDTTSWRTIVGVVKDTRTEGLVEGPRGTFYMPRAQEEMRGGWLIVRSILPTDQLTSSLRRVLAGIDRDMPLSQVRTMDAALGELVSAPRFSMLLLALFAAVALLLASVGIYGVISYNVSQRTGEIGVRIALGARRGDVVRLVVRQAVGMAVIGVGIGVVLALWGGKSLSALLYGVGPRDPLVLGSAGVFLLAVAFAAALVPAVRAARVDPTIAMRGE
jgi:putative ABC transport system permease protein